MITVTVYKRSDTCVGFSSIGHAEYAEEGYDIICAAVSALAINFYNSVETFTDDGFEGTAGQDDIQFDFRFTSDISPESQLLMNSLVLGLQNIENDYGKSYINIRFKEV